MVHLQYLTLFLILALITFSVEVEKSSTFINICIPYLSIEKVLDKLVVQYWFQANNEDVLKESRLRLKTRLNIVDIPVSAVLGKTNITVGYNAAAEGPVTKAITITYNGSQTKQITIKGEVWKTPVTSAPENSAVNSLKNDQ